MSPICARVRGLLPGYGREALPAEERCSVRTHLSVCAACREEALRLDPTLVFAASPPPADAAGDVAAVLAGVRAGIALKRTERRIAAVPRRRTGRMAAAAAVILLTILLPGGLRSRQAPAPWVESRPAGAAPGFAPAARPEVVEKTPGGATIYDWNPGGGEPRVVWIVDRSLDI